MPRPNPDGATTARQILTAAEGAFAERGFRGARLADIAAAVGIRRPSLLYHFQSKQALYTAVIDAGFDDISAVLTEHVARSGTPVERLDALVDALIQFTELRQAVLAVVLRAWVDPSSPEHGRVVGSVHGLVDALAVVVSSFATTGVPVRAAVLHLMAGQMVRSGAGPRTRARWPREDILQLARQLFLGG